ncbi:flagellar assembly peptidoglycan hydrolase FlgJ [Piscinibacter sp.]|uniref:flagellar assembly peptidoglycan hydrolase FlgJ n=1 Tax=Piscinibacter sp. TaxID=1903157 RepID=UPI00355A1CD7
MNLPSTSKLATDTHGIDALRSRAATDPKAAIKETAKQFEALFMQELMKSMRQAQEAMSSGMLDNAGSKMGTEMLDTQFATKMTGLPGGLSDVIARQLERQMGISTPAQAALAPAGAAGAPAAKAAPKGLQRQAEFLKEHQSAARAAEAQTGIPATFMVAQAAHESGWGKHEIRNADGTPSFNLFGIKAGANWKGPVAEVTTTEVIGGVARKVVAKFRAYSSYAESFGDYAKLMKSSPRYSGVIAQAQANPGSAQGFAQGLQRAGYASDPAYADKLTRVINTTLRLQRSVA